MKRKDEVNTRMTGGFYERTAGGYLESRGYRILEYNYRCRFAEIDIVAEDSGYLVFCEVKYRRSGSPTDALEAVDVKKQRRICRAALFYISQHALPGCSYRFDAVGIGGKDGDEIILIKNAFDFIA